MAAKGQETKDKIIKSILAIFPGAFMNGAKELRIAGFENGEEVQIKITLTAAKENVERYLSDNEVEKTDISWSQNEQLRITPTDEEIARLKKLMEKFGL